MTILVAAQQAVWFKHEAGTARRGLSCQLKSDLCVRIFWAGYPVKRPFGWLTITTW
jgi:hypothetical protein